MITSHTEHNSINRPLAKMAAEGYVSYDKADSAPDGSVPVENLEKLVRKETRLIAITHGSNVLGVVNPVKDYANFLSRQRHGIVLLLDSSQTVGVEPIDVTQLDADLVAFPGHKNLFGPMGTGALYVRPGIQIRVFREGGSGFKAEQEVHPEEMPFRLEGGTPNAHGYAGLLAGVEFVEREGIAKIRDHERRLALRFADGVRDNLEGHALQREDARAAAGPVSLSIRGALPAEVGAIMDEKYGIACRPGLHCAPGTHRFLGTLPHGTVRFSFGYFNTDADADAAVKAVNEVYRSIDPAEPRG